MSVTYVPAGIEAYGRTSGQLAVTYTAEEQEETSHLGTAYKRWHLRDRTVEFLKSGSLHAPQTFETADLIVPLASPKFLQACGVTKVLVNPIHGSTFHRSHFARHGMTVIVDSGGFQLLRGTVDFVDPADVVKRYNHQADIGMPLDLPVVQAAEAHVFHRVSNLIRANDAYIEPRLLPGKHLALISHGTTLKLRKERLDILGRPNAKVIAIAGLNIKPRPGVNPFTNSIENLLYVVTRYRKTAEYFHVLGVTSTFWMFVYAILSASKFVNDIGADSVTPRVHAMSGSFTTVDFQNIDLDPDRKRSPEPPCGCPVCFAVRDFRLVSEWSLLEAHNIWAYMHRVRFIEDLAKDFLAEKVTNAQVYSSLRLSSVQNLTTATFRVCMQYLLETIRSGTFRKLSTSGERASLFRQRGTPAKPNIVTRYEQILSRYEAWHKTKL